MSNCSFYKQPRSCCWIWTRSPFWIFFIWKENQIPGFWWGWLVSCKVSTQVSAKLAYQHKLAWQLHKVVISLAASLVWSWRVWFTLHFYKQPRICWITRTTSFVDQVSGSWWANELLAYDSIDRVCRRTCATRPGWQHAQDYSVTEEEKLGLQVLVHGVC